MFQSVKGDLFQFTDKQEGWIKTVGDWIKEKSQEWERQEREKLEEQEKEEIGEGKKEEEEVLDIEEESVKKYEVTQEVLDSIFGKDGDEDEMDEQENNTNQEELK